MDFDDLCDAVKDRLDDLARLKEQVPQLKVTLFAIPMRCSETLIHRALELGTDWLALAPHGWRHTRGECLAWTDDEAREKITMAREMGLDAPIFKPPAWLADAMVYDALAELDLAIASHRQQLIRHPTVRQYVYNDRQLRRKVVPIHGHLTPVMDNWLVDMLKDGRITPQWLARQKFAWPWEVATVYTGDSVSVARHYASRFTCAS
jgi:hypothetical protein